MAEHARGVARRIGARSRVEVGVTDAAGQAHEHFALLRLGQLDVLDDERRAELLENCPVFTRKILSVSRSAARAVGDSAFSSRRRSERHGDAVIIRIRAWRVSSSCRD